MIPNQWYPICLGRELRSRPLALRRMGRDLVAWRTADGCAVVMDDRCPHRGAALSLGKVRGEELECPWHGFRYDASGACRRIPCEGTDAKVPAGLVAPTYTVAEGHELVWLLWHPKAPHREAPATLPPLPWFDDFEDGNPTDAWAAIDWPVNHVRSIEANFDVHHFPFVHGSLFPGSGKRLDPYEVEIEDTCIRTRGQLRREGRSKGLSFRIDFVAPTLTRLEFSGFVFVVADSPVDAYNTRRHVVYRQSWLRLPGIGRFASWLFLLVDWKLLQNRQDLRVAASQTPRLPDAAAEHLVRADAGTAAYRKLRHRLLRESGAVLEGDAVASVQRDSA